MTMGGVDVAPTREKQRDRSLDGLRGVAALVVVMFHSLASVPALTGVANGKFHATGWAWWLTNTPLRTGWAGLEAVYVFFLLSGFVLMPRAHRAISGWLAYYPSRVIRLYLPVAGSLVLAVIVNYGLHHNAGASHHEVLHDFLLLGGVGMLNAPLWSLRWEVVFSLLLPIYALSATYCRAAWPFKALGLLAIVGVGARTGHESLVSLPIFALGCMLAADRDRVTAAWSSAADRLGRSFWPAITVASVLLLNAKTLAAISEEPSRTVIAVATVAEVVGAAGLLLIARDWRRARAFLEQSVSQWLGQRSFSLYLSHWPVIAGAVYLLGRAHTGFVIVLAVPTSLLLAEAFYRVVERPSHVASRQLGAAVRRRSGASGSAGAVQLPEQQPDNR